MHALPRRQITCTNDGELYQLSMPKFRSLLANLESRNASDRSARRHHTPWSRRGGAPAVKTNEWLRCACARRMPSEADKEAAIRSMLPLDADALSRTSVTAGGGARRKSLNVGTLGTSRGEMDTLAKSILAGSETLVGNAAVPSEHDAARPADGLLLVVSGTLKLQLPRPAKLQDAEGEEDAQPPPSVEFNSGEAIGESAESL